MNPLAPIGEGATLVEVERVATDAPPLKREAS